MEKVNRLDVIKNLKIIDEMVMEIAQNDQVLCIFMRDMVNVCQIRQ